MFPEAATNPLETLGQKARAAWRRLATTPSEKRTATLSTLAELLHKSHDSILIANGIDVHEAKSAGYSEAMIERLTLSPTKIDAMAATVVGLAEGPDPIGEILEERTLPNGIKVKRQRVPLGVMGVIYESRPNVTIDIAALALRTANAAILRGGKETLETNSVLVGLIHQSLAKHGLPVDSIQFIDDPDRATMLALLQLGDYLDVLVPRGGDALQKYCRENSRVPVITGGVGICHIFVDDSADLARSLGVIRNAKVQRPSVCNSIDTVLIHQEVAAEFIPQLMDYLAAEEVVFHADETVEPFVGDRRTVPLVAEDFDTEWLSLNVNLRVVKSLDEALQHIEAHGSGHSDGILTGNPDHAALFLNLVDSSVVFVNASTRFNDGEQMGLGGEVAVSTQRLHARGPMGLRELTSYKWLLEGDYHVRP